MQTRTLRATIAVAVVLLAACGAASENAAEPPAASTDAVATPLPATPPPATEREPASDEPAAPEVPLDDEAGSADDEAGSVDDEADSANDEGTPADDQPDDGIRCVVRLHGKGGQGGETRVADDGVVELLPTGNADGWGGRQWLYFPQDRYREAVRVVAAAVADEDCGSVVVNGFSNGAAFAAALWCEGDTLGGTLAGVVIDDPVTDLAVEGCAPADGVDAALYWTGGLDGSSAPGTDCGPMDWTCAGGELQGIDAYAAALGLAAEPSIHDDHQWWWDAPAIRSLLRG